MSELIDNSRKKKEILKHMILQLHSGEAPDVVRKRLIEVLQDIPYDDVVEVEQELISEGLPVEEVMRLCDIHSMVLDGHIDQTGAKSIPDGHPVDTFKKENIELGKVNDQLYDMFDKVRNLKDDEIADWLIAVHGLFNSLMDVDKHYQRKEYLLFPFLEKAGITGPPKVMWGKHDEIRANIKASIEVVQEHGGLSVEEIKTAVNLVMRPAVDGVEDMIGKEEEILLPMSMDTLTDQDWWSVYEQTMDFGFCLYDPEFDWKPENVEVSDVTYNTKNSIGLSTGSFDKSELESLFRTLPIDLTFVDKNDKVKFFSLGPDRIFTRNRAIIGRDVRMCHPPHSVHVVDQILNDFKSGSQDSAAFWINMRGRFIYIEYFALRGSEGEYLGTIEFTQDLTHLRQLEGEQRLLSYSK